MGESGARPVEVVHRKAAALAITLVLDDRQQRTLGVGGRDEPGTDEVGSKAPEDEVVGLFFDANGDYIDTVLNDRRISVSVNQLKSTPEVVAVAGQIGKARAIRAITASEIITCLVTTDEVARDPHASH